MITSKIKMGIIPHSHTCGHDWQGGVLHRPAGIGPEENLPARGLLPAPDHLAMRLGNGGFLVLNGLLVPRRCESAHLWHAARYGQNFCLAGFDSGGRNRPYLIS